MKLVLKAGLINFQICESVLLTNFKIEAIFLLEKKYLLNYDSKNNLGSIG